MSNCKSCTNLKEGNVCKIISQNFGSFDGSLTIKDPENFYCKSIFSAEKGMNEDIESKQSTEYLEVELPRQVKLEVIEDL